MNFYDRKEKCWLIRANKRITGPYTFQEVVDQILSGEVHLLDEVSGSLDRWRNLKDNPEFSAAIEQIRFSARSVGDNTVTARMDSTQTITRSITHSITQNTSAYVDDKTQFSINNRKKENANLDLKNQIDQKQILESALGPKKIKKKLNLTWIYMAIPAFAVGVYFLMGGKQEARKEQSQTIYQTNLSRAYQLKYAGLFQEAMAAFRKAYSEKSSDSDLALELAPLLVQYGADTRTARQIVETASASRHEDIFLKRANNIMGLSYSYEGKYSEATSFYKKGIEKDKEDFSLKLNAGYNYFLSKNYPMAETMFKEAMSASKDNSIAAVYAIKNYLDWSLATQNLSLLRSAQKVLNHKLNSVYDGRNEFLLFNAIILKRLGSVGQEAIRSIDLLLDSDPLLTLEHKHDPINDIRGLTWNSHEPYCQEVVDFLGSTPKAKIFKAYCLLLGGHLINAKEELEPIQQNQDYQITIKSLLAEIYEQMGDVESSEATIKLVANLNGRFTLPYKVLLRHCIKANNAECLKTHIDKFNQEDLLSYYTAHAYLANFSNKNTDKEKWLKSGLAVSPNYIPLVRLSKSSL